MGTQMYQWASDLFPICRSLSGQGVRDTLKYIQNRLPKLSCHEIPSGSKVLDWIVPDEWNIRDAYVMDEAGNRIIDFQKNNLHVLGYSEPVDTTLSFSELDAHLHSLPEQEDAIPYITSYYQRRWGFCLSETQRCELRKKPDAKYKVKIDSTLAPGVLNYGELIIPGDTDEEVFFSTYICHPSMANNELSGPVLAMALATYLQKLEKRRYTYRIIFIPETIGAIAYLDQHLAHLKSKVIAGFVLSCVGDNRTYSYVPSRLGNTFADRVATQVLAHHYPNYKKYSYLDRGSDERQYCSPGADLPVCVICRSKYGEYPEYHTSLDDLSLISEEGLEGSFDLYQQCIDALEANKTYKATVIGEAQLGRRGLYPSLSTKETAAQVRTLTNILAYCDGKHDILAISEKIEEPIKDIIPIIDSLLAQELISE